MKRGFLIIAVGVAFAVLTGTASAQGCPAQAPGEDKSLVVTQRDIGGKCVATKQVDTYFGVVCDDGKCVAGKPSDASDLDYKVCISGEKPKVNLKGVSVKLNLWLIADKEGSTCASSPPAGTAHRVADVKANLTSFKGQLCYQPGNSCVEIESLDEEAVDRLHNVGFAYFMGH